MNQMSLKAGAMANNSIDGGSGSSTDGDGDGGGGGIVDIDSRRHIDFDINDKGTTTNNSTLDSDQVVVTESTSMGADYYAKGSAEVATESALTLAKIQHVSSNTDICYY